MSRKLKTLQKIYKSHPDPLKPLQAPLQAKDYNVIIDMCQAYIYGLRAEAKHLDQLREGNNLFKLETENLIDSKLDLTEITLKRFVSQLHREGIDCNIDGV